MCIIAETEFSTLCNSLEWQLLNDSVIAEVLLVVPSPTWAVMRTTGAVPCPAHTHKAMPEFVEFSHWDTHCDTLAQLPCQQELCGAAWPWR